MRGYYLKVYKKDKRTKTGVQFIAQYPYEGYSGTAMMDEMKDLKRALYRPEDGWILEFESMESL
jgi:hypothetical protein